MAELDGAAVIVDGARGAGRELGRALDRSAA